MSYLRIWVDFSSKCVVWSRVVLRGDFAWGFKTEELAGAVVEASLDHFDLFMGDFLSVRVFACGRVA